MLMIKQELFVNNKVKTNMLDLIIKQERIFSGSV